MTKKVKTQNSILTNQGVNKYGTRKKEIDFAKIGEKLSLTGANCHYCKTIMTVKESNACRFVLTKNKSISNESIFKYNKNEICGNDVLNPNVLEEKDKDVVDEKKLSKILKRKSCNKKFCYDCLKKHFPSFWETRDNRDWKCPCCCNKCTCKLCRKTFCKEFSKEKKNLEELDKDSNFIFDDEKLRIFNYKVVLNSILKSKVSGNY